MGKHAEADVVIIGAGAGGLTAASLLSKANLKVTMLESQPEVGGYLACFERKGFRFNSSIEWLNECGPGGFAHAVFKHIGGDIPYCPPMTRIFRANNGEGGYLLTNNPLDMQDQLIRDFPQDEQGIRRFFADAQALSKRLRTLSANMQSTETMTLSQKIRHAWRMTCNGLPISKHVRKSTEESLRSYFKTEGLRQLFCSQETFMSIIVPVAWAFSGNYQKCPQGGSESIATWMRDVAVEHGTDIRLSTSVSKIRLNERGEAYAVTLADGQEICAKYVVAACDALEVYDKMLPDGAIPKKHLEAVRYADLYESCFGIFIGLDCPASELGFGEEALNLTRLGRSRADFSSGDPDKTLITIISPSERDATLAPAGKGSLFIHCPAHMDHEDHWKTESGFKRGEDYKTLKQEFADRLIDRIKEEYGLALREHIEMLNIATPITYWRYTRNAMGSTSGVKPTAKNIRAGIAKQQTPVKKLVLAGHSGEYGGGVPMAVKSGANASLIVLKDLNRSAFDALRSAMNGD